MLIVGVDLLFGSACLAAYRVHLRNRVNVSS